MRRQAGPDHDPVTDVFRIEVESSNSLWDCLALISQELDEGLAFRDNCFAGECGECGVLVDDREVLGCAVTVATLGVDFVVRPLRHHRVIRDLVVDRDDTFDRLDAAGAVFAGGDFHETIADDELELARRVSACLHCGLCLSACESLDTEEHRDFLGPEAMAWLARFLLDPRDAASSDRRRVADSKVGTAGCISCGACNEVCPVNVAPFDLIQLLR
jgi:succinate dehydrogenase/fumarate reductase iron-sulfur protein